MDLVVREASTTRDGPTFRCERAFAIAVAVAAGNVIIAAALERHLTRAVTLGAVVLETVIAAVTGLRAAFLLTAVVALALMMMVATFAWRPAAIALTVMAVAAFTRRATSLAMTVTALATIFARVATVTLAAVGTVVVTARRARTGAVMTTVMVLVATLLALLAVLAGADSHEVGIRDDGLGRLWAVDELFDSFVDGPAKMLVQSASLPDLSLLALLLDLFVLNIDGRIVTCPEQLVTTALRASNRSENRVA